MTDGDRAEQMLAEIAAASTTTEGVTRLPWTDQHRAAVIVMTGWMQDAGLEVQMDAAGTLVGRSPGGRGKPVLLFGSHQDSVRSGGRYDGIMGICLACLAARRFRDRWDALPFAVEVLAFADEEGVRFPTALIGPRALAGTLDPAVFDLPDAEGVTMRAAMAGMGVDADAALGLARDPARILGYVEAHIEQGPVLEDQGLPVGVVTGICGISRYAVEVTGETGHAGTVPMEGRKDALVTASKVIAALPDLAAANPGLRATVGWLDIAPNAVNGIPSRVRMTVETRSVDDAERADFAEEIAALVSDAATATRTDATFARTYDQPAVTCDPRLMALLEQATTQAGCDPLPLPSGATHDASAMADLCGVAMLFVRCRGGVSHRPDEYASAADMGVAVEVMARMIEGLAAEGPAT